MRKGWLIGLLAAFLLAGSCSREPMEYPELAITISIPDMGQTKALVGDVPVETWNEGIIKNLKIWVFLSEAAGGHPEGYCLGYLNLNTQDKYFQQSEENRYFIKPNDPRLLNLSTLPKVDVYALANASSIGQGSLSATTGRNVLDNLVISGNRFGINADQNKPVYTSVDNNGLPFSGVGKGLTMKGNYPVVSIDRVRLKRMVSKFRFVISQLVDAAGNVVTDFSIDDLLLDGGKISSEEYVFNESSDPKIKSSSTTYVEAPMNFLSLVPNRDDDTTVDPEVPSSGRHDGIAGCENPSKYRFDVAGLSTTDYQNLILNGIKKKELTSVGLCYLRETDQKLTGKIKYHLFGDPLEASFSMSNEGDFARNRSWIVYIYFLSNEIDLSVSWTPWEDGQDFYLP